MSQGAGEIPGPLTAGSLGRDPIQACRRWLEEAYARSEMTFPNAACLSTVGEEQWPEGRMILVKSIEDRGLVFFTNYRSAKGRSLAETPKAAVTFYWHDLQRQLRVRGRVDRISPEESDDYFRTRPRGSQIGAWASEQSEELERRDALENRSSQLEERFRGGEVPRPDHWGGYIVIPDQLEFWQGRRDRLHDRLLFVRGDAPGRRWTVRRLNP